MKLLLNAFSNESDFVLESANTLKILSIVELVIVEPAPYVEVDPTSSWSKQQTILTNDDSLLECLNDSTAIKVDIKLSNLGELINSSFTPII